MPGGFCIFQRRVPTVADARLARGDAIMSADTPQDHISKKRVVYTMPGMDAVTVRRDVPYRITDAGALTMDLYYPPDSKGTPCPAVVFVTGFADPGAEKMFGCRFKEMGSFVSWAQLAAASGIAAVTYANRQPAADVAAVLGHVRQNATSFAIDANSIGVWSCSGHAPTALSLLLETARANLKCAVLCYPFTLDLDGASHVAAASSLWRFVNACAGRSVDDLARDVPLFIARAGRDRFPGLNEALDRFVAEALARNLPVTIVNQPEAPHAFDVFDDSESSRDVIRRILAFLQFHLASADSRKAARQ
jgi:acetyl esterase/lipase